MVVISGGCQSYDGCNWWSAVVVVSGDDLWLFSVCVDGDGWHQWLLVLVVIGRHSWWLSVVVAVNSGRW